MLDARPSQQEVESPSSGALKGNPMMNVTPTTAGESMQECSPVGKLEVADKFR